MESDGGAGHAAGSARCGANCSAGLSLVLSRLCGESHPSGGSGPSTSVRCSAQKAVPAFVTAVSKSFSSTSGTGNVRRLSNKTTQSVPGQSINASPNKSFSSISNLGDRSHLECRAGRIAVMGRYHEEPHRIEDDYQIQSTVCGVGQSGGVRLAISMHSPRKKPRYAVKAFDIAHASENMRKRLAEEVEVFLCLDHPHIARLYDVYDQGDEMYLVMEYMEGGELFDRVVQQKSLSELEASDATTQILWALNYIHSHAIVHRDLKLENVVFDKKESNLLKLIDFGFSRIWNPEMKMDAELGTPGYIAPEVLSGSYTSQCDLWSLGVIVFIMLSGYAPFPGGEAMQSENIAKGRLYMCPTRWAKISQVAKSFTKSLLVVDPLARMSAERAMEHPWISKQAERSDKVQLKASVVKALRDFGRASKFRRCCLEMMAWSLSSEERAKVLHYFRMMDRNKQGTINFAELRIALKTKFKVPDSEINQIFTVMDTNRDEEIHYSDFLAAMVSTHIDVQENHLRAAFKKFDADSSGFITVENLREVLGDNFKGESADVLLSEADLLRDGRVSYEEFAAFLRGESLEALLAIRAGQNAEAQVERQPSCTSLSFRCGAGPPSPPRKEKRSGCFAVRRKYSDDSS